MDLAEAGSGLQDVPAMNGQFNGSTSKEKDADIGNLALCASNANYTPPKRKRKSQQQDSLGEMIRRGIVDHQLGLSVNLMLLVGMTYLMFPSLRETTKGFFSLSYPATQEGQWFPGPKDLHLVSGFVVLFTATRAACLDYVLLPLAAWCGIEKKKGRMRFAEQGYLLIYYVIYWSWGVWLFVHDTPTEVHDLSSLLMSFWRDFPRLTMISGMKLYYLSQLAFWVQQIGVINIEEPRKDHYQMLMHHCVTVALISGSHCYRQHRVGNAILVLMDIVDLIFPLAKILRYLDMQTACDCAFGLFVVCWFCARHVAYMVVCWSIHVHMGHPIMSYGTYSVKDGSLISEDGGHLIIPNLFQPFLNPNADTVAWNSRIKGQFLGLLLCLQCITIAWFVMICRVVAKVLRGEGADDTRSDDEDEEEEEKEIAVPQPKKQTPGVRYKLNEQQAAAGAERKYIEVESTSEDYSRPASVARKSSTSTSSKRMSKGLSSGLNLGEHKDILNRIGCLSEEQLTREREKKEESMSPRPSSSASRR